MIEFVIGWGFIAGIWLFISLMLCYFEAYPAKTIWARAAFVAPVWPLALVGLLCYGVYKLWLLADWRNL